MTKEVFLDLLTKEVGKYKETFDNYRKGYFNKTDAVNAGIGTPHYNNLRTYREYLERLDGLLDRLTRFEK